MMKKEMKMSERKPRNVLSTYIDPVLGCTVTVYKSRKAPKMKARAKQTKSFQLSTGIAAGFPGRSSVFGDAQ
jgi:hypothetical protein